MSLEIVHRLEFLSVARKYSTQFSFNNLSGLVTTFNEFAKLHVTHTKVRNRIILTSIFVEVAESLASFITYNVFLPIELA